MRDIIVEAMARLYWASEWANHADEHRCSSLSGCDVFDVMPPVPDVAREFARRAATRIEAASELTLVVVALDAKNHVIAMHEVARGGVSLDGLFALAKLADPRVNDGHAERFGHALAYKTMGAGPDWTDDFKPVPGLEVPYMGGAEHEVRVYADTACSSVTNRVTCAEDRKSTRLNSSHLGISYAV